MAIRISTSVVKMLTERGMLPDHCAGVELVIPPNGAMYLTYKVFVADEHLLILADAFTALATNDKKKASGE